MGISSYANRRGLKASFTLSKRVLMEPAPASWTELLDAAMRRASRAGAKSRRDRLRAIKELEASRVKAAASYVSEKLKRVALSMPFLDSLHPFYRELVCTMVNEDEYRLCLSRLYSVSMIVRKIARESLAAIARSADAEGAARARRAFMGRLRSLLEGLDDCITRVRAWQVEIAKLPSIDPLLPSIIIAGPPNVGKSSLLRRISRAKPEVRPYPFTTTNVIVGHLELAGQRVQAVDTPGLLDRPLTEKGPVERRAVAALKYLKGVVVFIFDPTATCGFPLDYQLAVYRTVKEVLEGTPTVVVANKVDITKPEQASELVKALGSEGRNLIFISALEGTNVDYLLDRVKEALFPAQPSS